MELDEIDQRLQRYTAAEHRIGSNLLELQDHAIHQLHESGVLVGATAAAFEAATSVDPSLFELHMLLGSALDRARSVRGTGARVGASQRDQLATLLDGPSIVIERTDVPLADRGLTDGAERVERVTIAGLIERMRRLYEPLRDAITRADAVLDGLLPRLTSADQTLERLRGDARQLGLDAGDLVRITETIERIRDLSLTDPLAIPPDARASLDRALHDAGARVAGARASHDAIAHDLTRAHDLLDRCRNLIAEATAERARAHHKIVLDTAMPIVPNIHAIDGPKGLATALDPIAAQRGPWQQTRRALDAWTRRAERFESQLARVEARIRAPLERRAELRGRLSGFRAKMSGVGRSEEAALTELSDEVHNELYTAPTDLDRAERLLADFGARLAS